MPHAAGQTGSFLSMAPEVVLKQPYNEKADIFSLGCCMVEVRPFSARCLGEMPCRQQEARRQCSCSADESMVSEARGVQMGCMYSRTVCTHTFFGPSCTLTKRSPPARRCSRGSSWWQAYQ